MTGKHDKSVDDEQSSNLLLTGPIVIRGLGRGVKDAFVRGRPSRHRAFTAEGLEQDVRPAPLRQMLAGGPMVGVSGPSSDLPSHAGTQAAMEAAASFPSDSEVPQTGEGSPREVRMDDRPENAAPAHDDEDAIPRSSRSRPSDAFDCGESVPAALVDPIPAQEDEPDPDATASADPSENLPESREPNAGPDTADARDEAPLLPLPGMRPVAGHGQGDVGGDAPDEGAGDRSARDIAPVPSRREIDLELPEEARPEGAAPGERHVEDMSGAALDERGEELASMKEPSADYGASRAAERTTPGTEEPRAQTVRADDIEGPRGEGDSEAGSSERSGRTGLRSTPLSGPEAPATGALIGHDSEQAPPAQPAVQGPVEPASAGVIEQTPNPGAAIEERPWFTAEELFSLPSRQHAERDEATAAEDQQQHAVDRDDLGAETIAPPDPESSVASGLPPGSAHTGGFVGAPGADRDRDHPPIAASAVAGRSPARNQPRRRPLRERVGPETAGIAVLVVLALVCAGLIAAVVIKTRNDASIAASEAANYTPPPPPTPETSRTGPVVAVIGDGSTTGAASRVAAKQRWNSLLASSLGGTVRTGTGRGYAARSTSGETFVKAATAVPSDAAVVVFFGGAADHDVPALPLAKAATDAYSAAMKRAPDAKIVVVGPVISAGADAAELRTVRDTLRAAAAVVDATWVDPIDEDWVPAAKQSASPGDLSVSDEKAIASKMQAAVKKALG